jgi:hypothetical protein
MGYAGQLSSRPLIGIVVHVTGLTAALGIPAVLLVAVAPPSRLVSR